MAQAARHSYLLGVSWPHSGFTFTHGLFSYSVVDT